MAHARNFRKGRKKSGSWENVEKHCRKVENLGEAAKIILENAEAVSEDVSTARKKLRKSWKILMR